MRRTKRKISILIVTLCMICFSLMAGSIEAHAKSKYSNYYLKLTKSNMTLYVKQTSYSLHASIGAWNAGSEFQETSNMIRSNLTWTSSNPSVIGFVTDTGRDTEGNTTYQTVGTIAPQGSGITLLALAEGTSTITATSDILNQSYTCKITVKNAELTCEDDIYYEKNTYNFSMQGNATGLSYSSSNPKVAVIDEQTGVVTTKKKGKATLSCIADDGNTYTYELKVKKRGLSYTKLTTYCYTGLKKGVYTQFPLIAKGIKVKKWQSSNKKVCKVEKKGNIGLLKMLRTGKTTITCIGNDGKKYKCKVTVVGGKPWGGLNGGYSPTLSTLKKHGYFKDINSVKDYGNVVFYICDDDYYNDIKLKNGNKHLTEEKREEAEMILKNRYPNKTVYSSFSDYLIFTDNSKKKTGRIRYYYHYVK